MRPRIICHMISSIDGRLLVQRWTPPAPGVAPDIVTSVYEDTASQLGAQGFIVGRATMAEFKGVRQDAPSTGGQAQTRLQPFVGRPRGRQLAIVADPGGKLRYESDDAEGAHVVALLSEEVSEDYLQELRRLGVSYLFGSLAHALEQIRAMFEVSVLLLEGGGAINGSFLKECLIDEVSLLIYPGIDGLAGTPCIFDYRGGADEHPAAGRCLVHTQTRTLTAGVVWLRYEVTPAPSTLASSENSG
ncbi:dihydrofolate reductase family protein [Xanthomonas campestris]|uniref:dihydrofolate reductase family protein n=2 Tax=Xanthomonas TaxID=338 RepID=UPI001E2E5C1B|nr:dihydrofolate reductase family protein [Xanthomonas campestris]MCC5091205.1 dihydrofolate reductase family protein [Xanthomonas campestris]